MELSEDSDPKLSATVKSASGEESISGKTNWRSPEDDTTISLLIKPLRPVVLDKIEVILNGNIYEVLGVYAFGSITMNKVRFYSFLPTYSITYLLHLHSLPQK